MQPMSSNTLWLLLLTPLTENCMLPVEKTPLTSIKIVFT